MSKKEKYTFEEALHRLEEIVSKLEDGDVPLEDTIKLFQEGTELINFCNKKLEEVKFKVEMVVKNKDGFKLVDFEEKSNENFKKINEELDLNELEETEDEEDESNDLPF